MAQLKFFGLDSLPTTLQPDAFYYVLNGDYAESYVTDDAGNAKMIGNTTFIDARVADALANWAGGGNQLQIVADIAARDALAVGATYNIMALVLDASDDPTVDAGSAMYAYSIDTTTWFKVAEYESMDVQVQWDDIIGGPSSSVAAIDAAVAASHTHANKATLDDLTTGANDELLFKGAPVTTQWEQKDW